MQVSLYVHILGIESQNGICLQYTGYYKKYSNVDFYQYVVGYNVPFLHTYNEETNLVVTKLF